MFNKQRIPDLTLYYFPGCPYCIRVIRYLLDLGINIPMKDTIENPEYLTELVSFVGKTQVPCLVIDGDALYESELIVAWFEDHLDLWNL